MSSNRKINSIRRLRKALNDHKATVVMIVTDEGDDQFWLAPFLPDELEKWWIKRDTFTFNPNGIWDALYTHFGETPPPHRVFDIPGKFIDIESYAASKIWIKLADSGKHYLCHFCCDEHAYLRRPDRSMIFHAGKVGTDEMQCSVPNF